jgi:archaemetzincin
MNKLLLLLFLTSSAFSFTEIHIAIQPFGAIDTTQLKPILPFVSKEYNNAKIEIVKPIALPKQAYYKPRSRYRAEIILQFLDSLKNGAYDKVVGFTDKDISTTKGEYEDWGIFGLGDIDGYACVVSTFRLKKGNNKDLFKERLKRIIIHELGHTFGLAHCDWPQCVMANYKGTIRILDDQWFHLCSSCRKYFREKQDLER